VFKAEVINSKQSSEEQGAILGELYNGTLDCIIQVQMLGEGFDHPKLSVAAIFRPFRSLAPYVQFVGRIMRVIVQNNPTHPDNVGHIVTHLGMNIDARLKEFKDFENDDKAFWDKVIGGEEPETPAGVREGKTRLRANERVVVHDEIVEELWEEDFTNLEDQQIIDDLRERFTLLGLDPSQVEEAVKKAQNPSIRKIKPSEPFIVQPQREWEEARRRVDEQAKRLANILLNHVELTQNGTEMSYKYKSLRLNGRNNYISALMMVNAEINKRLGKQRSQASTEEFKEMLDSLDEILQKLVRQVRKAKADYDNSQT
jgi:superfamily II DNA or RNA helicase